MIISGAGLGGWLASVRGRQWWRMGAGMPDQGGYRLLRCSRCSCRYAVVQNLGDRLAIQPNAGKFETSCNPSGGTASLAWARIIEQAWLKW